MQKMKKGKQFFEKKNNLTTAGHDQHGSDLKCLFSTFQIYDGKSPYALMDHGLYWRRLENVLA